MERLRGTTMNQRVHKAMEYWLEAIKFVQECRKREIANATKRQKENPPCILVYNDNGMFIAYSIAYSIIDLVTVPWNCNPLLFKSFLKLLNIEYSCY